MKTQVTHPIEKRDFWNSKERLPFDCTGKQLSMNRHYREKVLPAQTLSWHFKGTNQSPIRSIPPWDCLAFSCHLETRDDRKEISGFLSESKILTWKMSARNLTYPIKMKMTLLFWTQKSTWPWAINHVSAPSIRSALRYFYWALLLQC